MPKLYPIFFILLSYRTTSVRAPSRIVRTPYTRIISPHKLFLCFWVKKIICQCYSYSKSKFPCSKRPIISRKSSKVEGGFSSKKLVSLIVRMRTNRGRTVFLSKIQIKLCVSPSIFLTANKKCSRTKFVPNQTKMPN